MSTSLLGQRARARALAGRADRPEREMAVDLDNRAELAGACDERLERRIAQQLMARADEQPAASRASSSSAPRIGVRQRKRLFDVHVRAASSAARAASKCAAGGVQMCTTSGLASVSSAVNDGTRCVPAAPRTRPPIRRPIEHADDRRRDRRRAMAWR